MELLFQGIIWHTARAEDVFNDEQLSSVDNREDYLGNWIGYSQKHFVVAVYDRDEQQNILIPAEL